MHAAGTILSVNMSYNFDVYRILAAITAAACLIGATLARAQDIPSDEPSFTAYVAERMRAAIGDAQVRIKAPLTLSIGSMQGNLDRVFLFCKRNGAGCAHEIDTYVKAAVEANRNATKPTRESIRIVVRPAQYLRQLSPGAPVLAKPLVEGLVVVPVLDSSRTVRVLTEKDGMSLGLTANQLYEAGVANIRKSAKPLLEVAKAVGPGQIGRLASDYYQPSRLALIESWAPLAQAQGGTLIVTAPATDTVLYVSEDSRIALDALRTLARGVMARVPNPLFDTLLRWTPRGWQIVQ
jgi:uncharacterized protein YtpQ (UPF0354 family)